MIRHTINISYLSIINFDSKNQTISIYVSLFTTGFRRRHASYMINNGTYFLYLRANVQMGVFK